MNVTYGNEFQPSLRDLLYSRLVPNAEALGYFRLVPSGLDSRRSGAIRGSPVAVLRIIVLGKRTLKISVDVSARMIQRQSHENH